MRSRYPLIPILFLFLTLAAAETPSPVVELPLLGEAEEAFPGLGWVRDGESRIQVAAVSAAVDEGMSVLVFAPDGGKAGELRLLGGDVAAVTNRCGALGQWEGISLWIRGGGRPSDLVLQWGARPTHEVRVRNDFKHWKKVHVPWSHFRPSIDPENPPSGPLRVGLERLASPPSFTLVCADPYGTNLTTRTWREARANEAVGVGQWKGTQLAADQLRWPDSEGLSMWVKMEGRPVYAQAAWLGALDRGKPFQVVSNFWQQVRVEWSELPPPPRLPPVLRISVEAYPYQGDWAMLDRLRLYRGVADEDIEPTERVEPPVDRPARTWIRNDGDLDPWRARLSSAVFSPRVVVLADSSFAGPGLDYLGRMGEALLAHTAPRQLAREMRLRHRFQRMTVGQEMFQEGAGRFVSLAETSDPFAQGFRLHSLHANGIRSLRRAGAVERAKSHHPDWVLVMMGHLDVDLLSPEAFRGELQGLLQDLQAAGLRPIVVSPVPVLDASPPVRLQGASYLRRGLDFRQICDDLAQELDLPFADLTLALLHRGTAYPGNLYADPFLLNREGHRFAARLLFSTLDGSDVPLWHDVPEPLRMRTANFDLAQYVADRRGVDLAAKAPSILDRSDIQAKQTRSDRERDAVNLYIQTLLQGLSRGGLKPDPITPPRD